MLRRVRISGYKSLRDTEIDFTRPLTLILGPNAAGKSNLFDVLALCSRMVTQRTLQDAFRTHRGSPIEAFTIGETGIRGLLEQPTVEMTIELDVELSQATIDKMEREIGLMRVGLGSESAEDNEKNAANGHNKRMQERYLRYTLHIEMVTREGFLRVKNEELAPISKDGKVKGNRREFVGKASDKPNKLVLRLEGQAHPSYFDVGLDYTLVSSSLYPPHYPHIVAFREELSRWRFYYMEPHAMREPAPLKNVTVLSPDGSDLAAFYNTLKVTHERQFEQTRRELRMLIPQIESFDVIRTDDGFLELTVQENGTTYSARVISEGTLRVLGLLALTNPLTQSTLIGLEEPENGVHARRLKLIADHVHNVSRLRQHEMQILLNSHSPWLPQHFSEDEIILCQRDDQETTFAHLRDKGLFLLPNHMEGVIDNLESAPTTLSDRLVRGDYGG